MNITSASLPYEVIKNGENHVFKYKKSKLGFRMLFALLWPSLLLAAFLAYRKTASDNLHNLSEKVESWVFYTVLFTVLVDIGALVLLNLFRLSGKFTISKQGFLLGETLYPYNQIQRIYIKTPSGDTSTTLTSTETGYIVLSNDRVQTIGLRTAAMVGATASTVANTAVRISDASGKLIRHSIKIKSYKVCFRFGKKEKVLANKLSESNALLILQEIDRLI
ncbi:MAG: hypothetical protein U0U70_08085 [Chitinophagaceae bacterium]